MAPEQHSKLHLDSRADQFRVLRRALRGALQAATVSGELVLRARVPRHSGQRQGAARARRHSEARGRRDPARAEAGSRRAISIDGCPARRARTTIGEAAQPHAALRARGHRGDRTRPRGRVCCCAAKRRRIASPRVSTVPQRLAGVWDDGIKTKVRAGVSRRVAARTPTRPTAVLPTRSTPMPRSGSRTAGRCARPPKCIASNHRMRSTSG